MVRNFYSSFAVLILVPMLAFGLTAANSQAEPPKDGLRLPVESTAIMDNYCTLSESGDYELKAEFQQRSAPFTEREGSVIVQGDHFGPNTVNPAISYLEIGRFQVGDYMYKLVVYSREGEADTQLLNTQLNSYDHQGLPVDAVLLDSRFAYECSSPFSEFQVTPDMVEIKRYVIFLCDMCDYGCDDSLELNVPKLYRTTLYRIDQGRFQLISKTDVPGVI